MIRTQQELSQSTITLHPKASHVIKTKLQTPPKTKVFLNICSDDQVPFPDTAWSPEVVLPLIMENKWEIPIITSPARESKDKKGDHCLVFDCVVHSKCLRWCILSPELSEILNEWCFESVELRDQLQLDRDSISKPKMMSKGDIPELTVLKEDLELSTGNRLNEEFERKILEKESSPTSFIQELRMNAEKDELLKDEEGDVDIFNINRDPLASRGGNGKALIQEINDMKIDSTPSSPKAPSNQPSAIKPIIIQQTKPKLKYETTIAKLPELHPYKLRLNITSQITTSLDYDLSLNAETMTLHLHCQNVKEFEVGKKGLEVPLPLGMSECKAYFCKGELVVFVR